MIGHTNDADPQKDNGIVAACFSQSLYDQTRSTGNICPSVSSDLRLIAHTAQRDPLERPIECFGHRLAQRRLSRSRWPNKSIKVQLNIEEEKHSRTSRTHNKIGPLMFFLLARADGRPTCTDFDGGGGVCLLKGTTAVLCSELFCASPVGLALISVPAAEDTAIASTRFCSSRVSRSALSSFSRTTARYSIRRFLIFSRPK